MSDPEFRTAIHEAGHTLLAIVHGLAFGPMTIKGTAEVLGAASVVNPLYGWERGDGARRPLLEQYCQAVYAGREAEIIIFGSATDGSEADDDQAAAAIINSRLGVPGGAVVGDDRWERYCDRLRRHARAQLQRRRTMLTALAQALYTHPEHTLTPDECRRAVAAR